MIDTLLDWVSLLVRWTHVIAGIAWIGSSFYFIALDASLKPDPRLDRRVSGEAWQVHGGGFYNIQKYTVAPDFLPEHLTWFKWEAYGTWIFGFALLVLVYYLNPSVYLIDTSVMNIDVADAVPAAAASLVIGWFVYDLLCRSWFGRETGRLAISGFILLVAVTYGYTHVFSGRGAFIQVGALVGTIMAANVLIIIIPNQRKTVAAPARRSGTRPDLGLPGRKQRSIHNNYLTLPVVFTMLSNHYSFTYSSRYSWLILACIFVASFLVRHWFNTMHTGAKPDWRLWPAAAVPVVCAIAPGHGRPVNDPGRRCRRPGDLRGHQADRRPALPCLPRRQAAIPRIRRGTERRDVRHPGADQAPGVPDHGAGGQDPYHAAGQRHRDHGRRALGPGIVDHRRVQAELTTPPSRRWRAHRQHHMPQT